MTADYQLELTMEGTSAEIKDMLGIVGLYDGERPQYFSGIKVNGKSVDFKNLTENVVAEITSTDSKVTVTALGPYGRYAELNEVGLFREMAEAAPKAQFKAEISGNGQYEVQNLKCELVDGKLNIKAFYESNEESGEAWKEDFMKKLPLKKFKKLFNVSGEDFNKESYSYFLDELESLCYDGFEDMEYDDFVSTVEDNDGETELEEDEFSEIMESKLSSLDIMCPAEFEEDYDGGSTSEYVYDPVAKSYIGEAKPLLGFGEIGNANDLIAAGLKAQGLPSDEDTVANLSIEDAYAALGAAMGGQIVTDDDNEDEEDDEEDDDWDDEEDEDDEE